MDNDDSLSAISYQSFDLAFIQIKSVRPDICEDNARAAQRERIGRGGKRKRRDDDFISGLETKQQRGHFQRVGT